MKKYKVTIACKTVSTVEVEAENEAAAKAKAQEEFETLDPNEPGTVVDSEFEIEEA